MPCSIGTDVDRAAELLRAGGLVAFPTETVYGLAAAIDHPAALARIFEVKARPRFDPLIVHVADAAWLEQLVRNVPPEARRLIEAFWPGPLTIVLPKTEAVPDLVTAGLATVAVRMPAEPLALELLSKAGVATAAPSANRFGRLSPTRAEHVAEQLGESIDYILDGGACRVGVESTVIDLSGERPQLLRPGGLPLEDVAGTLRVPSAERLGALSTPMVSDKQSADGTRSVPATIPPSPGMLARHYAPSTPLYLQPQDTPPPAGKRAGLLTLRPPADTGGYAAVEVLSESGDLREAAAGFFAALRRLDALGLDCLVAHPLPEEGLGRALNDRLRRAAASQ